MVISFDLCEHKEVRFMTLIRWDPFRNVATLQDRINRIFEETFPRSREVNQDITAGAWKPMVDVYETEEGIIVKADLPGVRKADVSVEIKDNFLNIRGERKTDSTVAEENYYRQERCFGTFHRSFRLRASVDPGKVKARFKDGILEIQIPRPEEDPPKRITVDVE